MYSFATSVAMAAVLILFGTITVKADDQDAITIKEGMKEAIDKLKESPEGTNLLNNLPEYMTSSESLDRLTKELKKNSDGIKFFTSRKKDNSALTSDNYGQKMTVLGITFGTKAWNGFPYIRFEGVYLDNDSQDEGTTFSVVAEYRADLWNWRAYGSGRNKEWEWPIVFDTYK